MLASAVSGLLCAHNDKESSVRMLAGECLNVVIKTFMDAHLWLIQVELFKEIKAKQHPRAVRTALVKFADLAPITKPLKRKVLAGAVIPVLVPLVRDRDNVPVQETLAEEIGRILFAFHLALEDVLADQLFEAFVGNLTATTSVVHRAAAEGISALFRVHPKRVPVYFDRLLDLVIDIAPPPLPDSEPLEAAPTDGRPMLISMAPLDLSAPKSPEPAVVAGLLMSLRYVFDGSMYFFADHLRAESLPKAMAHAAIAGAVAPTPWQDRFSRLLDYACRYVLCGDQNILNGCLEVVSSLLALLALPGVERLRAHVQSSPEIFMIARRLCRLLLAPSPQRRIMISSKSLCLQCLSLLARGSRVLRTAQLETGESVVAALLPLRDHDDPLIAGRLCTFLGACIDGMGASGALNESRDAHQSQHNEADLSVEQVGTIVNVLFVLMSHAEPVARRLACAAAGQAARQLLSSAWGSHAALALYRELRHTTQDGYWLVRSESLAALAAVDFRVMAYAEGKHRAGQAKSLSISEMFRRDEGLFARQPDFQSTVLTAMMDQLARPNPRLQETVLRALVDVQPRLYWPRFGARRILLQSFAADLASSTLPSLASENAILSSSALRDSLSHTVVALIHALQTSQSRASTVAVYEALLALAARFTESAESPYRLAWESPSAAAADRVPNLDRFQWSLAVGRAPRSSLDVYSSDIVPGILTQLSSGWMAFDLSAHTVLLQLLTVLAAPGSQLAAPANGDARLPCTPYMWPIVVHCLRLLRILDAVTSVLSPADVVNGVDPNVVLPPPAPPAAKEPSASSASVSRGSPSPAPANPEAAPTTTRMMIGGVALTTSTLAVPVLSPSTSTSSVSSATPPLLPARDTSSASPSAYVHLPHYHKLSHTLLNAFRSWCITLRAPNGGAEMEQDALSMFVAAVLQCLTVALSYWVERDDLRPSPVPLVQELLTYVQCTMRFAPAPAVACVSAVLAVSNGVAPPKQLLSFAAPTAAFQSPNDALHGTGKGDFAQLAIYDLLILRPSARFANELMLLQKRTSSVGARLNDLRDAQTASSGSIHEAAPSMRRTRDRPVPITAFEGLVLRAMHLYNDRQGPSLQRAVLSLLCHLLLLRVNYVNQRFLALLQKQLEEPQQLSNPSALLPVIFDLMLSLAVFSRTGPRALSVPSIFASAQRLLATGHSNDIDNAVNVAADAPLEVLVPLVEHLPLLADRVAADEIAAARSIALRLLIDDIGHPVCLDALSQVMRDARHNPSVSANDTPSGSFASTNSGNSNSNSLFMVADGGAAPRSGLSSAAVLSSLLTGLNSGDVLLDSPTALDAAKRLICSLPLSALRPCTPIMVSFFALPALHSGVLPGGVATVANGDMAEPSEEDATRWSALLARWLSAQVLTLQAVCRLVDAEIFEAVNVVCPGSKPERALLRHMLLCVLAAVNPASPLAQPRGHHDRFDTSAADSVQFLARCFCELMQNILFLIQGSARSHASHPFIEAASELSPLVSRVSSYVLGLRAQQPMMVAYWAQFLLVVGCDDARFWLGALHADQEGASACPDDGTPPAQRRSVYGDLTAHFAFAVLVRLLIKQQSQQTQTQAGQLHAVVLRERAFVDLLLYCIDQPVVEEYLELLNADQRAALLVSLEALLAREATSAGFPRAASRGNADLGRLFGQSYVGFADAYLAHMKLQRPPAFESSVMKLRAALSVGRLAAFKEAAKEHCVRSCHPTQVDLAGALVASRESEEGVERTVEKEADDATRMPYPRTVGLAELTGLSSSFVATCCQPPPTPPLSGVRGVSASVSGADPFHILANLLRPAATTTSAANQSGAARPQENVLHQLVSPKYVVELNEKPWPARAVPLLRGLLRAAENDQPLDDPALAFLHYLMRAAASHARADTAAGNNNGGNDGGNSSKNEPFSASTSSSSTSAPLAFLEWQFFLQVASVQLAAIDHSPSLVSMVRDMGADALLSFATWFLRQYCSRFQSGHAQPHEHRFVLAYACRVFDAGWGLSNSPDADSELDALMVRVLVLPTELHYRPALGDSSTEDAATTLEFLSRRLTVEAIQDKESDDGLSLPPATRLDDLGGFWFDALTTALAVRVGRRKMRALYGAALERNRFDPSILDEAASAPLEAGSQDPAMIAPLVGLARVLGVDDVEVSAVALGNALQGALMPPEEAATLETPRVEAAVLRATTMMLLQTKLVHKGYPASAMRHEPRASDILFLQRTQFGRLLLCVRQAVEAALVSLDGPFRWLDVDDVLAYTSRNQLFQFNIERVPQAWRGTKLFFGQFSISRMSSGLSDDFKGLFKRVLDSLSVHLRSANSGYLVRKESAKAMLLLSDLFDSKSYYEWMLVECLALLRNVAPEDFLTTQYAVTGVCKAMAALKVDPAPYVVEVTGVLERAMVHAHRSMHVAALHGILYLLEAQMSQVREGK